MTRDSQWPKQLLVGSKHWQTGMLLGLYVRTLPETLLSIDWVSGLEELLSHPLVHINDSTLLCRKGRDWCD